MNYLYFKLDGLIQELEHLGGVSKSIVQDIETQLKNKVITKTIDINSFSNEISLVNYKSTINILKDLSYKVFNNDVILEQNNIRDNYNDTIKEILLPVERLLSKKLKSIPKVIYNKDNIMLETENMSVLDFYKNYTYIINNDKSILDNLKILDVASNFLNNTDFSQYEKTEEELEVEKNYVYLIKIIINNLKTDDLANKTRYLSDAYNTDILTIGFIKIIDHFKEDIYNTLKENICYYIELSNKFNILNDNELDKFVVSNYHTLFNNFIEPFFN